jgi:hypothetical protein
MKTTSAILAAAAMCGAATLLSAQAQPAAKAQERPIPKLVQKDGRYALLVDGAPFLMLGAQTGNSSAWPAMLPNPDFSPRLAVQVSCGKSRGFQNRV